MPLIGVVMCLAHGHARYVGCPGGSGQQDVAESVAEPAGVEGSWPVADIEAGQGVAGGQRPGRVEQRA